MVTFESRRSHLDGIRGLGVRSPEPSKFTPQKLLRFSHISVGVTIGLSGDILKVYKMIGGGIVHALS